jgi:hypothetical protein
VSVKCSLIAATAFDVRAKFRGITWVFWKILVLRLPSKYNQQAWTLGYWLTSLLHLQLIRRWKLRLLKRFLTDVCKFLILCLYSTFSIVLFSQIFLWLWTPACLS